MLEITAQYRGLPPHSGSGSYKGEEWLDSRNDNDHDYSNDESNSDIRSDDKSDPCLFDDNNDSDNNDNCDNNEDIFNDLHLYR